MNDSTCAVLGIVYCLALIGFVTAHHFKDAPVFGDPLVKKYEACKAEAFENGDTSMYHRCTLTMSDVYDAIQQYKIQDDSVEYNCFKRVVRHAEHDYIQECLDGDNKPE